MRTFHLILIVALAGVFLTPLRAVAGPVDDIRAAVVAGGSPSVKAATEKKFSQALASVMTGKSCRKVSEYAAAATKLRPDLAKAIFNVAIAAVTPPGGKPFGDCVARIAAAMTGAEPSLASQIVLWAVVAAPDFKSEIVTAVIGAAPDQAVGVNNAVSGSGGFVAPAGFSLNNLGGADAGIVSGSGIGSINPANVNGSSVNGSNVNNGGAVTGGGDTISPPSQGTNTTSPVQPGG